jgi:hypothetical protein
VASTISVTEKSNMPPWNGMTPWLIRKLNHVVITTFSFRQPANLELDRVLDAAI